MNKVKTVIKARDNKVVSGDDCFGNTAGKAIARATKKELVEMSQHHKSWKERDLEFDKERGLTTDDAIKKWEQDIMMEWDKHVGVLRKSLNVTA
jgi:hypothetical protein